MDAYTKSFLLLSTYSMHKSINTRPDYQRPAVWRAEQKQLLIDTVLRGYDIPKLYLRKIDTRFKYEVVDGQQRLRAIWDFFAGKYAVAGDAESIEGVAIAGMKYHDLPEDLRLGFDGYPLDVVVIQNAEEAEVRKMFLRLQSGMPLNAQEKRNAFPGKMRDFVVDITCHNLFKAMKFSAHRYAHDHAAAQLIRVELAGSKPANIKKVDLDKMYRENENFDENGRVAKRVKRVLSTLREIFSDDSPIPELERFNMVPLYCMVAQLLDGHVFDEVKSQFRGWFVEFEQRRVAENQKPVDARDPGWANYREKIGHSGDSEAALKSRLDFLTRDFFKKFPDLPAKDERNFTEAQKLAIYWRDGKKCQIKRQCDGTETLPFINGWHCDHIVPWSKGGKTTVENGQVACQACNLAKGNNAA